MEYSDETKEAIKYANEQMKKRHHSEGPWEVEVSQTHTSVEAKYQTVCTDVSNCDADLIAAAPEMLEALKRIVASAPLTGLPRALELDIQAACAVIAKAEGK